MGAVTIRPGRADDLPHIAAIEESGAETFTAYGQPLADGSPPGPPDHWSPALEGGLLWIAEDADVGPIGFLAAARLDGGLYVEEVDVIIDRQREGHGRRLMQTAIDRARTEGLAAVTLTTFRAIPWNAPFYSSLGFHEVKTAEMPPHLAAALANEAARGFQNRCGMRLAL